MRPTYAVMNKERKAWTVAIGNFQGPFAIGEQQKVEDKILEIIKGLDGLIGIHPHWPAGTLILFENENAAKRGRNRLESEGIHTGKNIGECFIPVEEKE